MAKDQISPKGGRKKWFPARMTEAEVDEFRQSKGHRSFADFAIHLLKFWKHKGSPDFFDKK